LELNQEFPLAGIAPARVANSVTRLSAHFNPRSLFRYRQVDGFLLFQTATALSLMLRQSLIQNFLGIPTLTLAQPNAIFPAIGANLLSYRKPSKPLTC